MCVRQLDRCGQEALALSPEALRVGVAVLEAAVPYPRLSLPPSPSARPGPIHLRPVTSAAPQPPARHAPRSRSPVFRGVTRGGCQWAVAVTAPREVADSPGGHERDSMSDMPHHEGSQARRFRQPDKECAERRSHRTQPVA
jgi:hypothetical protein